MRGKLLQDYQTEQETARDLGVSVRTLRLWRQRREGPAWVKVGKRVVYAKRSILGWLESSEQQPVRRRRAA